MKRFKNILVCYDSAIGGDDALEQGVALARANGACLTVVTVLRERQLAPAVLDETGKRLERISLSVRHAGVPDVRTRVRTGTPYVEIVRQVIAGQHDLVILSAETGSVIKGAFFGNVALQLMRKCPCPVWVVKPGQSVPCRKILAAVDPREAAPDDDLNVKIMDLATSLASRDRAGLHILHAWEVDGNDGDTVRSELTRPQRDAILDSHLGKRQAALDGLLAGYPMSKIDHRLHLPREYPEQAIGRLVEQEGIDLIVMGTLARSGLSGFLIGNTAESVMNAVKCGMLTVKPDGFETPVYLPDRETGLNREPEPSAPKLRRIA